MQTQDVSKVQLGVLLGPEVGVRRNEMSILGESIHNHPYGIILMSRERQTHDEIHVDVFLFPGRNILRLQQSGRPQMICLDPSTRITFCHVASSLARHSSSPELRF
jgi:hypothetical protein